MAPLSTVGFEGYSSKTISPFSLIITGDNDAEFICNIVVESWAVKVNVPSSWRSNVVPDPPLLTVRPSVIKGSLTVPGLDEPNPVNSSQTVTLGLLGKLGSRPKKGGGPDGIWKLLIVLSW